MVYQGPIQPGTSEKIFRKTGKTVNLFQGPVRPGTDVTYFRETGKSRPSGGGSSGGGGISQTQAAAQEEKRLIEEMRQAGIKRQQQEAAKLAAQLKSQREQKIQSQTIGGQVEVSAGGKVSVGSGLDRIKYSGTAFIPEFGMTAGEYNRSIRKEAVESGQLDIKDIGRIGFSGFLTQKTPVKEVVTKEDIIIQKQPTKPVTTSSLTSQLLMPFKSIKKSAKEKEFIATEGTKKLLSTEIRMGWIFGTPTGKKISEVKPEFTEGVGIVGESVGGVFGKKETGKSIGTMTGKVIGIITPETAGELAATVAIIPAYKAAPPIARIATSTYFGVTGTKTALDPIATKEERILGGIVGATGLLGAGFEAYPFVRGQAVKFSPKYKPVKTQPAEFKAVTGDTTIGLIEPGAPLKTGATTGVKLPSTSALKRGGFGVTKSQKPTYLGKEQTLATSQQSFFKAGKNIILDREFYITPQDPTLKIATARVSRLGLSDPFKITPEAKFGFGFPKTPQIGVEVGGTVTRTGVGRTWTIGRGTELEAIKGAGTIISGVKKTGVTTIKGQAVDLFKFTTSPSPKGATIISTTTTLPTATTSAYGAISTSVGRRTTRRTPKTTTTLPVSTLPIPLTTAPLLSKPISIITPSKTPRPQRPSYPTYQIFQPTPFITSPTPSVPIKKITPYSYPASYKTYPKATTKFPTVPILFPKIGEKSKRTPFRIIPKTKYQTSLTGSILGIKGTGLFPGGLSVRGILEPTNKKKNKIL